MCIIDSGTGEITNSRRVVYDMTKDEQIRLVEQQFAIDYNCLVEDFKNKETLVTIRKRNVGARKFEDEDSLISMLSYNGKLVITADEAIVEWCEEVLKQRLSAEWCFEANSLISIDKKLGEFGYGIDQVHLFFLPKFEREETNMKLQVLEKEEIVRLEEDERIDEAFLFDDYIQDMLGVAVMSETGEMLAVAGATDNSERMWEMGINSFKEGNGYGQVAISRLIQEVIKRGKVPFYGTALSHCASQNVALRAGMVPSFCELRTTKLK